jgi:hypothetical protein
VFVDRLWQESLKGCLHNIDVFDNMTKLIVLLTPPKRGLEMAARKKNYTFSFLVHTILTACLWYRLVSMARLDKAAQ